MKIIKCLIVGDGEVGKTSLITQYTMEYIRDEYIPTIFDTYFDTFLKGSREATLLQLWDSGGSKEYDHYRPLSYPDTDVILICFSITSPDSFENVESRWYPEIRRFCPNTPIGLIGMKHDLLDDKETRDELDKLDKSPILLFEGLELAQRIGAFKYCECSAKTGYGLQNVFDKAVSVVLRNKFLKKDNFWEDHEDEKYKHIF